MDKRKPAQVVSFKDYCATEKPIQPNHKLHEYAPEDDCTDGFCLWFFTGIAVAMVVLATLVMCVWKVVDELPAL